MVQRHEASAFGSAYAFPGGVVEADDAAVHEYCGGLAGVDANVRLGISDGGLDYYSAAVRELFEESGILLANLAAVDEDLSFVRDSLNDGSLAWSDFVQRNKLILHCETLHYVSHWITPQSEPKRYSTRFFVTALPGDQPASHCGGELTASRWSTAADMLAAERGGEVELVFPTVKTLESIARHRTFEELMEWARSSVEWGITTMVPLMIVRDGEREIVLPGDKDYPGAKF